MYRPLRQENEFRPDLADVEGFLKSQPRAKAIFLNSPHNPTGGMLSAAALDELARLATERDFLVLSDEIYARIVYEGTPESVITPLIMPPHDGASRISENTMPIDWVQSGSAV